MKATEIEKYEAAAKENGTYEQCRQNWHNSDFREKSDRAKYRLDTAGIEFVNLSNKPAGYDAIYARLQELRDAERDVYYDVYAEFLEGKEEFSVKEFGNGKQVSKTDFGMKNTEPLAPINAEVREIAFANNLPRTKANFLLDDLEDVHLNIETLRESSIANPEEYHKEYQNLLYSENSIEKQLDECWRTTDLGQEFLKFDSEMMDYRNGCLQKEELPAPGFQKMLDANYEKDRQARNHWAQDGYSPRYEKEQIGYINAARLDFTNWKARQQTSEATATAEAAPAAPKPPKPASDAKRQKFEAQWPNTDFGKQFSELRQELSAAFEPIRSQEPRNSLESEMAMQGLEMRVEYIEKVSMNSWIDGEFTRKAQAETQAELAKAKQDLLTLTSTMSPYEKQDFAQRVEAARSAHDVPEKTKDAGNEPPTP
jgi:hypothetical protein